MMKLISVTMNSQSIDLINPKNKILACKNWSTNDDDVRYFKIKLFGMNNENNLIFSGYLSLENNGGFASTRHRFKEQTLAGVKSFKINERRWEFILLQELDKIIEEHLIQLISNSSKDKWTEVEILLEDLPHGEDLPTQIIQRLTLKK